MGYYTAEQEARWEQPTRVRPVGRGGAVHTLHPDTGKTYCGAPAGRALVESEMTNGAPWCRTCLDEHSHLVNGERHDAFRTRERLRAAGKPVPGEAGGAR